MLAKLLGALFGCWHRNYGFPITIKPRRGEACPERRGTYVVCLDCGQELAYDWNQMRVAEGRWPQLPRSAMSREQSLAVPQA